jgi:hypothetical protein
MSRPDDETPLDAATLRALRDAGELIPTNEAEVEQAERTLPELELPASLRRYEPREPHASSRVRHLASRRTARAASHLAVAALAALAAGLAVYWSRPTPVLPATSAGGELVASAKNTHTPRVPLVFQSRCERECCAGSECRAASESLRSCPSGARCIACGADYVTGGPYRLRIGTAVPSAAGQTLLPLDAPLELCVSAPTSPAQCVPAVIDAGNEPWRLLKQVSTVQDLLSGLTVELRKRGESAPLATWKQAVSPTPDVMCKGLAIQLSEAQRGEHSPEKAEVLARVSAFVEQAHFVELSRSATVPQLLAAQARFDVSGIQPHVYETSSQAGARFALVLGPVDKSEADALRWQALDHGVEAQISHGLDFLGKPRPTP